MRFVQRGYLWLLNGMALLAAIMLVWLMVAVVLSVVIRNLGLQPSAWFFLSTEYAMFYLTLLGAPWLVRQKGHVHIELLTSILPPPLLNILSRAVALVCVLVSLVLAWKGLDLFLLNIERSDYDVRAFFVPKWILTSVFPVSFTLMAVEFGRFVVGPDILHSGEAGIKE
ncbi:TRAP transporter small permease [Vreelandella sp. EE7]